MAKVKKQKEKNSLFCQINDDYVDINEEFSWKENLEDNQKKFVIYYCYQFIRGQKNLTDAARKAGYKDSKSLKTQAQLLLKNPKIYAEIKNIRQQITKTLTKLNLENEITRIIQEKIARTRTRAVDFYTPERFISGAGTFIRAPIKLPEELTEEQKKQIAGIRYDTQRGIPNYEFYDVSQEEKDLINIYKNLFDKEEDNTAYSTELTIEQIKDKVTATVKLIKENESQAEIAGVFIDKPNKLIEEA